MRARALVGWEGCEVRLCDPCARVSPLCPRVSWLSPRTCLLYEILPGSWRVVVRVRWWLGWLIGWFKVGCEVRDTCVPCVWRLSRLPWFYRFARFGCPCVPCLSRVPWVSRLPPVSFYRFATKFTETSVAAEVRLCSSTPWPVLVRFAALLGCPITTDRQSPPPLLPSASPALLDSLQRWLHCYLGNSCL